MNLKKTATFLIGMILISTSVLATINTDGVTVAGNEFKVGEQLRVTGIAYTDLHGMFPRIEYTLTTDEGQTFRGHARNTMIRIDKTITFTTPGTHYANLQVVASAIVSTYHNGYWHYYRQYETAEKTFEFSITEETQTQEETNTPPVIVTQYYNTTPTEYVFDASNSYDTDGVITSVEWDLGDGTTSNLLSFTHEYQAEGTYLVTLTITDDKGAETTASMQAKVTMPQEETPEENHAPTADAGSDVTAYVGEQVAFNGIGTDPDGDALSYAWDFNGDGVYDWQSPVSGTTVHAYDAPGTYTAYFKASDGEYEAVDSITVTVLEQQTGGENETNTSTENETSTETQTAQNQAPTAYAGQDKTAEVNEWVTFIGTGEDSDGSIVKYEWDFNGDGNYDWSSNANGVTTYKYDTPGTYTATLRVTDDEGATSTSAITVVINAPETVANEPTTGEKYFPEFATSQIDVYKEYYYDASEAKTYVTMKVSNLGNEPRTFLIKDVIPKAFAEHIDEATITPAPDKIYSADPEIGWNVTLNPLDTFVVQYKFSKYVSESEFQNMTSPKIIEMPATQTAENASAQTSTQPGLTGLVVGAFATPLNALAVVLIIALAIAFWKKETIIEKWHEIRNKE